MILGSPEKVREKLVHRYSRLSGKKRKVRKYFEQIEEEKKCIIDKNVKGHFVIWCYVVLNA